MNSKVVETVLTLLAIVASLHYASKMLNSSNTQKFTEVTEVTDVKKQETNKVENEDTDFLPYKSGDNVTPGAIDVPMMTAVDNADPKKPQPDDDFYGEYDIPSEYGVTSSKGTKEELNAMEEEVKKNMKKSKKESSVKPYDDEEEDFGAVVVAEKK